MSTKLSILICHIPGREHKLSVLLDILNRQKTDEVEILIEKDNKEITTGAKRNILLRKAKGDYIAFVDDDDLVFEGYIPKILKAIESKPDCCGIEGVIENFGKRKQWKRKFIHSIKHNKWYQEKIGKDTVYFRCPNHLSPVKRSLALKVMFEDITQGEDRVYSMALLKHLKIEEYIEGPIYHYITGMPK